jgi:hypothetical protein
MARAFGPSNDKACCACGGGPDGVGLLRMLGVWGPLTGLWLCRRGLNC